MTELQYIKNRVHELYWKHNVNCAGTALMCLSHLFGLPLEKQTLDASVGMHGGGGFRAQCGLVEGGLMFIGVLCGAKNKTKQETEKACFGFCEAFLQKFGSLGCGQLRPDGFRTDDPPHLCEKLTCDAVEFSYLYIKENFLYDIKTANRKR